MKFIIYSSSKLTALSLLFLFFINTQSFAQPHLKGQVYIDMEQGLFECNLTVSNIPDLQSYRILLNKGMNIKYFRDSDDQLIPYGGYYNGKMRGESIEYVFTNDDDTLEIPASFSAQYVGAFPVYKDSLNLFDFAGYVAINNQTLRTTAQTAWYPLIYDSKNDRIINQYTYDLELTLKESASIFVNGSIPIKGKSGQFTSKKARPLLLFIGDYNFFSNEGNYLLNVEVNKQNADKIIHTMDTVKAILAKNIGQEFTDNIFVMSHTDVNKIDGGLWAFNQYPTFAFSDLDFDYVIEAYGGLPDILVKVFGHEFSHNYFNIDVYSGILAEFWGESFPEYLSFNIVEEIGAEGFLNNTLLSMVNSVKDQSFTPLTQITNPAQMGDQYRYMLGPLILKCFEDTFGREKMNNVIKILLKEAKSETLTLESWKAAALRSGITKSEFEKFFQHFVEHEEFKDHVISFIIDKYN